VSSQYRIRIDRCKPPSPLFSQSEQKSNRRVGHQESTGSRRCCCEQSQTLLHFCFRLDRTHGPEMTNPAAGLPARVRIPVLPSATSHVLYELLARIRLGFLVVSSFRIACKSSSCQELGSKRILGTAWSLTTFIYFNMPQSKGALPGPDGCNQFFSGPKKKMFTRFARGNTSITKHVCADTHTELANT
jgi:hypothetical protein